MLARQLEIVTETDEEREARADRIRSLRDDVMMACRAVAREHGYDGCAAALDRVWGPLGRPVSASALRSALHDVERNNFRFEWVIWFAEQSDDVRALLREIAGEGAPKKKPEDELRDLKAQLRSELGKVGEKLIRKAAAP